MRPTFKKAGEKPLFCGSVGSLLHCESEQHTPDFRALTDFGVQQGVVHGATLLLRVHYAGAAQNENSGDATDETHKSYDASLQRQLLTARLLK